MDVIYQQKLRKVKFEIAKEKFLSFLEEIMQKELEIDEIILKQRENFRNQIINLKLDGFEDADFSLEDYLKNNEFYNKK